jgi:hypothetical protein
MGSNIIRFPTKVRIMEKAIKIFLLYNKTVVEKKINQTTKKIPATMPPPYVTKSKRLWGYALDGISYDVGYPLLPKGFF